MSYLMASKTHMLDTKTWKFVKASSIAMPDSVAIPRYLLNSKLEMIPYVSSCAHYTNAVNLNNLSVTFTETSWSDDTWRASIRFLDTVRKCVSSAEIAMTPRVSDARWGRHYLRGFNYMWRDIDGTSEVMNYSVKYMTYDEPSLKLVTSMGKRKTTISVEDSLNFGIRHIPFKLVYKDKILSGKYHVMLCGGFAIILEEDMSFQGVVLINAIDREKIEIERFLYVTSSYLVKIKILMK